MNIASAVNLLENCVTVSPGLKELGVVGPKHSTDGGT